MFGKYKHTLDPKGRLFVPAKLREELGSAFYVARSLDPCLTVYTEEEWQRIVERSKAAPSSKARGLRTFFANVVRCEPDKQGRFLLPDDLRKYAGIQQEVYFLGQAGRGELGGRALRGGRGQCLRRGAGRTDGRDRDLMEFQHKSVLLQECIDALNIRPDGIYLDGTLGGAGHSSQIARRLTEGGRLIGVDRDRTALAAAKERLAPYADRVTLVHSNFAEIDAILDSLGIPAVDGMLFDLGVSSPQLDDASRGFSYMADAPLDMRMDKDDALTAGEVVNTWPQGELRRILYDYGEERYAPQIAAAICRAREKAPVETTLELVDIIRSAMPAQALREKQHPAKRSFQAIRIAVNDELGAVSRMMQAAVGRLNPGGRLAVITFHSLEDRIVKSEMQQAARGCTCPPEFPVCVCGKKPLVKLVTRKPIVSGPAELEENPRARSAKLRVAEKL